MRHTHREREKFAINLHAMLEENPLCPLQSTLWFCCCFFCLFGIYPHWIIILSVLTYAMWCKTKNQLHLRLWPGESKVEVREREGGEEGVRLVSASAKYILYNCTWTYKRVCFGGSRQQQKPKQKSDGQKSWTIKLWLSFASGRPNCFIMNVNLLRYAKQTGCIYPEHVLLCVFICLCVCVCACISRLCVWHFSHEIRMWVRLVGFYLHSFRGEQQEGQLNT